VLVCFRKPVLYPSITYFVYFSIGSVFGGCEYGSLFCIKVSYVAEALEAYQEGLCFRR